MATQPLSGILERPETTIGLGTTAHTNFRLEDYYLSGKDGVTHSTLRTATALLTA